MFCKNAFHFICWPVSLLISFSTCTSAEDKPGFNWSVNTQISHDDNVYRTTDQLATSDTLFTIKPKLKWLSTYSKHKFDLSYHGDYGQFSDEKDLNYHDHQIEIHTLLDHSHKLNTDYLLRYHWDHDHPGETEHLVLPGEKPHDWKEGYAKFGIAYGTHSSKGQLVGELKYHQRNYTNTDLAYLDYDWFDASSTFYYRIAPKTRALIEVNLIDIRYSQDDAFGYNWTNNEYRYLTGITWNTTAKTTSILKIGYRDKSYDDNRFNKLSGLYLWLDAQWEPNTHTLVTLSAAQDIQESTLSDTYSYVHQYFNAGVEHNITSQTQLVIESQYGQNKFEGNIKRDDVRWHLLFKLKHNVIRWVDLSIEYRHEKRDSTVNDYDFRNNILMLSIEKLFNN
jgi:hypothetical protein